MKMIIQLIFLSLTSWVWAEDLPLSALPDEVRRSICQDILQSDGRHRLPLNGNAVAAILLQVMDVPVLQQSGPSLPLFHPEVQEYVKVLRNFYEQQASTVSQEIVGALAKLDANSPVDEIKIYNEQELSPRLAKHLRGEVANELHKIPLGLRRIALRAKRGLLVTLGPITQAPRMAQFSGITPPGWDRSWDLIPGAGGGEEWASGCVIDGQSLVQGHGSASLIIHEVLHEIDYGRADFTGGRRFSESSAFLQLRDSTYYPAEDWYMRDYPYETFAEFGAMYFASPESREYLRDVYPQWFDYFRKLEMKFGSTPVDEQADHE